MYFLSDPFVASWQSVAAVSPPAIWACKSSSATTSRNGLLTQLEAYNWGPKQCTVNQQFAASVAQPARELSSLTCVPKEMSAFLSAMFFDCVHQDISLNIPGPLSGSQRIEACPSDVFRCRDLSHGFEL